MQPKHTAFIIIFFLFGSTSFAQSFYKDRIPRLSAVSGGLGGSFMYSDNGGSFRNLGFKLRPTGSLSYSRHLNTFLDIKGTFGFQMMESQDPRRHSDSTLFKWYENDQALGSKGTAYYVDVMPVFHLFPYVNHIDRPFVNVFAGIGIGVMGVWSEELRGIDVNAPLVQKKSMTLGYVPMRAGVSFRIGPHSDLAIEGSFLATFSDDIDGNTGHNRFNDHLFQGQVVFKRYLSPIPFWLKYMY